MVYRRRWDEAVPAVIEFDIAREGLRGVTVEFEAVDVALVDAFLAGNAFDQRLERRGGGVPIEESNPRPQRLLAGGP